MTDLAVVCFFWGDRYRPEHVLRLRRLVAEHLPLPHKFVCQTNRSSDLPDVECRPLRTALIPLGNAYPKLEVFGRDAEGWYGARRLLILDLDVDIVGDLTPIVARPERSVLLQEFEFTPSNGKKRAAYNTSVMLLEAGVDPEVWERFARNPLAAADEVRGARIVGSDQAWVSIHHKAGGVFSAADGIRSYRFDVRPNGRRQTDRIISYHGRPKPWELP